MITMESEREKSKSSSSSAESTKFTDLEHNVLREILSRLPVQSLIRCRLVCRDLRNIITKDPDFAWLHFSRSSEQFLLQGAYNSETLHLFECDRRGDNDFPRTKFRLPRKDLFVLNSCNGFLCLRQSPSYDPCAVFNPVTGEYLDLPRPEIVSCGKEYLWEEVVSGFGCSSRTNQYKVVRRIKPKVSGGRYRRRKIDRLIDVYTLGEKSWRKINWVFPTLPGVVGRVPVFKNGVFLNGFFHWLLNDNASGRVSIVTFDFENEEIGTLPLPPGFLGYRVGMAVLKGCLYVNNGKVWQMKEYGVQESWTVVLHICPGDTRLVKRLDDGTLLTSFHNMELIWRVPTTSITDPNWKGELANFTDVPPYFFPVVHVSSFVLLKGNEEEAKSAQFDMQVRRVFDRRKP